jgi:hypothetical protein
MNWPMPARVDPATNATRLEPSPVATLLIPDDGSVELPPARRLLVLVPGPATPTELASRIWSLVAEADMDVLFIGAAGEGHDDYTMRRLLATLAAATRDGRLRVETRLVRGQNWLQAIRAIWQPGDLILCHREQTVTAWGFQRLSLAQALVVTLNAPVYVLSGFYLEPSLDPRGFVRRWLRFMLPFLIIGIFFMLQVQIEMRFDSGVYYLLMIGSVIVEIGLLAVWH